MSCIAMMSLCYFQLFLFTCFSQPVLMFADSDLKHSPLDHNPPLLLTAFDLLSTLLLIHNLNDPL